MSYNKYPKEMKDAVVSRIISGEATISDICRETGININTLYRWRDAPQRSGLSATTKYKNADKWSSQDKFIVVLETANLSEIEFSEYCRNKGIYPEAAKSQHPERWSKETRNWKFQEEEWLNSEHSEKKETKNNQDAKAS